MQAIAAQICDGVRNLRSHPSPDLALKPDREPSQGELDALFQPVIREGLWVELVVGN